MYTKLNRVLGKQNGETRAELQGETWSLLDQIVNYFSHSIPGLVFAVDTYVNWVCKYVAFNRL